MSEEVLLHIPSTASLRCGGRSLDQRGLFERAAEIAEFLRVEWRVRPGDRVAIMQHPGLDLVPSILGAWLSGAAYVPLDASFPDERLAQILAAADVRGILTHKRHRVTVGLLGTLLGTQLSSIELDQVELPRAVPESASLRVPRDRPAYLIFTSGSTGVPKGVVCTFGGLENLSRAVRSPLSLDSTTRHLHFAALSFDASVWDIFPTLFAGGTVVHVPEEERLPGKRFANLLRDEAVTHLCLPPSILGKMSAFADELPDLRLVVMAGERCPPALATHWRKTTRVINAYGPTEITVCATLHEVTDETNPVPIGRALDGVQLRIVDAAGEDCVDGVPGELWVGGEGVAAGYHNRPDLTAKSFPRDASGAAWYRTSDEVVRESNGDLVFIGRLDQQVKLRGFRIELGAIEEAIYLVPGIAQVAVRSFEHTDVSGAASGVLVAYFSVTEGQSVRVDDLRARLVASLPDYMVPHFFLQLPSLPLAANGSKIDPKALPAPEAWTRPKLQEVSSEIECPKTPLERLTRLFAKSLSSGVARSDTHYFQAGGDSLGVANLLSLVEAEFGVELPSRIVYAYPTPEKLLPICLGEVSVACDQAQIQGDLLRDAEWRSAVDLSQRTHADVLPRRVLLTGATGFLGSHLVATLLPKLERLYCLVRGSNETDALARLVRAAEKSGVGWDFSDRVCVVVGDITEEHLGLSAECYEVLASECDAIVHAAANISYILPYADAGAPNARGTRNIIEFACHGVVKPIHHVSSMSVYGASATLLGMDVVDEGFDVDQSLPIMGYENGYTRAKWVAEKMLRHASAAGVPVSVYRPGFIQGDTHAGFGNPDDLFCRYVVGSIQRGVYPDFPGKYWLPVPVDYEASAMAHIVATVPAGGTYNLLPPRDSEPSNNELFEMVATLGFPMKKVPPPSWLRELAQLGPDNALYPLVGFLREKVWENQRTVLEIHHRTSEARCSNTHAALAGTGMVCSPFNAKLLARYLDFLFSKYTVFEEHGPAAMRLTA